VVEGGSNQGWVRNTVMKLNGKMMVAIVMMVGSLAATG
jgi:hypothetical protein